MNQGFSITPDSKVAALLDSYPELEDDLIAMAPPFTKLKNPILRRSVAKIASLRQAAAVGGLDVEEMVNTLRAKAGQEPLTIDTSRAGVSSYFSAQPDWYDPARVMASIDGSTVDPNTMPLKPLLNRARRLVEGEIVELITTFLPAPGIDVMQKKGYLVWVNQQGDIFRTYFTKP